MILEFTLLTNPPYIIFPAGLVGWLGWGGLLALSAVLAWQSRVYSRRWLAKPTQKWVLLAVFAVLAPLTSLFFALRLPAGEALSLPNLPQEPVGSALLPFSALPWMLAAGFLGPLPAAGVGFVSGLAAAFWETHSAYTPLELSLLAMILGFCLHQRNRTRFYSFLRRPLIGALLIGFLYPVIYLWGTLFSAEGSLAIRVDYALSHLGGATTVMGVALILAGVLAEMTALAFPKAWGGLGPLQPSPVERRLQTRFLYSLAPLALILVATLMIGDWVVATQAAQEMLRARMASTAEMAAENIPFFIYTGKNLLSELAGDERLYTLPVDELSTLLDQKLLTVPFFNQLFTVDDTGAPIAASTIGDTSPIRLAESEVAGVRSALNGVSSLYQAVPPLNRETNAVVSFMAVLRDESGVIRGVLVGRSDIATNPFTQPVLTSLKSLVGEDGEGMLLDGRNRILYDSSFTRVMETYDGQTSDQPIFYTDSAPDGTRRLVFYQPALGEPWAIVLIIPARQAQQQALRISAPLLVMLLILFALAAFLLRIGLRVVTASLQNLASEANRIASGRLDHPLASEGEDEVGQTRRSFEQMRLSLKARLEELNRLLTVSQGVASSLEMDEAVRPVLEAALATGASGARVTLEPAAVPEMEGETSVRSFGIGHSSELYACLDEQILALTRHQERVMLTNPTRSRVLNFPTGLPRPEAILAFNLQHENSSFGALWLIYDQPRQFTEDETRFLATLASQTALAAANARLFLSAEIGRQRLAAILASTPDPVLVTDHRHRLLLANPAAWHVVGVGVETGVGQPVDKVIPQRELAKLLRSTSEQKQSAEIPLPDGKVYLATASPVMADNRRMGRVCVLRDVTHFKELDSLKSEFVATVSHDLRSPLTLMRGYATMLEMVGNLNEQQTGYVRKIVTSVETMSRLVNNLLDLGRIEAGIDLVLEMVPVHDTVDRVISVLQLQATQKRIQLSVDMPPHTIPLVEADQALLQQGLQNMVENAIKYTEPGGKVTVRVYAREDKMTFEVSDTGIGIAPVDIPRLFEKFYRAGQRESKKQTGTGLGLAIVKSIAERHGGRVEVESQLGKGSTFTMAIPLRQPRREPRK